ncbi:MAG: hypothetical protein A3G80_13750 [Betaproteobacteria bacterium RIFCSPLOWO2_12_FULL_62_13b]|nr:MAG: hypothetical protein A3G80_13750 [Betaproteobacteria bacterium RIFCSPLOWO2_12_FULL_62_13b]
MKLDREISESIKNGLVPLFAPSKIIVFGSYATGMATEGSDIDILVLVDDERDSCRDAVLKGRLALRNALRGKNLPFDLLVETTRDFDRYRLVKGSIQREIDAQGMVLYEH